MRVHHYENDGVKSFDADAEKRIGEYIEINSEEHLFLVSDDGREIEVETIIKEVIVAEILPVVVHAHTKIEVTVHYGGRETSFKVSPGVRVGAVRTKAIKALGIDDADAADLGLRTMNSTEDLPANEPIGKVVGKHHHQLQLQLGPMVHPQG